MVLSNPGTQYMSLSAGIAQEPVSMTPRLMAETFCFAPAQTLASPSTVRWSSGYWRLTLHMMGRPGCVYWISS